MHNIGVKFAVRSKSCLTMLIKRTEIVLSVVFKLIFCIVWSLKTARNSCIKAIEFFVNLLHLFILLRLIKSLILVYFRWNNFRPLDQGFVWLRTDTHIWALPAFWICVTSKHIVAMLTNLYTFWLFSINRSFNVGLWSWWLFEN